MVTGKGNEGHAHAVVGGETDFGRALDELKSSGSGFLVTGAVPPDVHEAACRYFLGADSPAPRGQVVLTGSSDQLHQAPNGPGDRRRVVELSTAYRSAEADTAGNGTVSTPGPQSVSTPVVGGGGTDGVVTANGLRELGLEAMDAIEAVSPLDGFDAGELRLCFDAFDATAERVEEEALFQFLHLLLSRVRGLDGLVHVHYRGEQSDPVLGVFEPLFDGVVELRTTDHGPEQRWHLSDADLSSEWLALDA